jgi:eukaryotic-like serine/threonine-protein kinase
MYSSSQNRRLDDEHWKIAFEILERCRHLPLADRREFAASATDDPGVLDLFFELLADETDADVEPARDQHGEPQTGERIGRYEVASKLEAGGMGQVYSARDLELGRPVALKFLSGDLAESQEAVDKLMREARAASALNHRNIVTVHEVVRSHGRTAIVMELLEGKALRSICGRALPLPRLIRYGEQLATALAAAHRKGIVHGDIKPENVMVDHDDFVKVVDFGMARPMSLDASATLAGTITYFSPEQGRGERATSASDIFSLGSVLYELATGVHPFRGETKLKTLYAIVHVEPVPPLAHNSQIPRSLNRLILDMLSKQAERRPSADEVVVRLSRILPEDTRARRRSVLIISALILLVVVGGIVLWTRRTQAPTITLRELTSADVENRVTAAAIAPDGSQFAYADVTGTMLVRSIENKRDRLLRPPPSIVVEKMEWFPDSSALLVVGRPLSEGNYSAWIVRLDDVDAKLVRENIDTASLSPDGARVAFTSADSTEIWLTHLKGNLPARMLVSAGENESFPIVIWSAKGKYLICQRRKHLRRSPNEEQSSDFEQRFQRTYESIDASTGTVGYRRPDISMRSATVQADGRVLFVWPKIDGFSTNVWQMKTDPETGRIEESPRALTEYRDMALAGISASSDGKRIVVVHYHYQPDVYVADFDSRTKKMTAVRRVTIDRAHDYPHSFSPDGQTVFFESNRNGTYDIFRQGLDDRHAEFLAGRPDRDEFDPLVTPDGKWILYASTNAANRKDRVLERIPVDGGEPASVPTGGNIDYFDCALPGHGRCILRTTENQEYVFYDLDPVRGKGAELARVPWSPGIMGDWSLSADGLEVAIPNHDVTDRLIRVVPLGSPGAFGHVVRLKGGAGMISSVHYSADGAGWLVVLRHGDEYFRTSPLLKVDLVYVDRQGSITPLREIPITSWAVAGARGQITFPDGLMTGNAILLER